MNRAIAYTRVSTDKQAKENLSLQGQRDQITAYAKANDMELVEVYEDAGESAKTANRPQLIRAIEFSTRKDSNIDYFIVWKFDRFARNASDHMQLKATLLKQNVRLVSVTEPLEANPTGDLMEIILAGYGQFDNATRTLRSTDGLRRRLAEGGWPHLAPIGYKNVKDILGRPTLEQTELAPKIAKWLREYLKGGLSVTDMQALAYKKGILSRKGKVLVLQQVVNMLRSPLYAGIIDSAMLDVPVESIHKGIITPAEHEAILERLDGKKKTFSPTQSDEWPLRGGFIVCEECGSKITGSAPTGRSKKKYPQYHCPTCRVNKVGHAVSIPRDKMHVQFEALLAEIVPSEAHIRLFREVFVKKWQTVHQEQTAERNSLEATVKALNERRDKIVNMFIDGALTSEEKQQQTQLVNLELYKAETKLSEVKGEALDSEVLIDFAITVMQNASALWNASNNEQQQRLQEVIFPEGLTYNFVEGFGTAKTSELYEVVGLVGENNSTLVGLDRVELSTKWL
jgi:site-specific DNA recombinase